MYSEELDLCHRVVDAGWQVVYDPQAVVTHYEGKSSEQVVAARHIRFHTSRVRYVRKYHGTAAAEAVRVFGAAAMRLRFAAAGTWLHAIIAIIFAISIAEPFTEPTATIVSKTLGVTMFGFYYVGLVGPRRLVAVWTHRELYRYLRLISSHRPDQLADEVPADLARAAAHSVVSAASAVMLTHSSSSVT